jgi:AsmA protein
MLLAPALAWSIVLAVVPTEWAKNRLVDRLSKVTGRTVTIGALRLGVLGNLRVQGISLAERGSEADPWLRVGEARLDVHLGQLLLGPCEPGAVELDGVDLRLIRRLDGSSEVADLIGPARGHGDAGSATGRHASGKGTTIMVTNSRVLVVDVPNGTRLLLENMNLKGTVGAGRLEVERLESGVGGGSLVLAAALDRDSSSFQAEVMAHGVALDQGLPVLGYLMPVVSGATDRSGGKLDLKLALSGQGSRVGSIRRSLRGHGTLSLAPVDLSTSKFLHELDVLGDWPASGRVGSVAADFTIDHQRITTDDLTVRASQFPLVLAGWTDFDGRFDYRPQLERMASQLPREARGWLGELGVNRDHLAGLRVRGTIDDVKVTVNNRPLEDDPGQPDGDRAKLRDTARRIRDRFFR